MRPSLGKPSIFSLVHNMPGLRCRLNMLSLLYCTLNVHGEQTYIHDQVILSADTIEKTHGERVWGQSVSCSVSDTMQRTQGKVPP